MIKHIDSYTRIALKDTVHIFTGVLLYSFTGVLFHGQGAETCFFGELWTFSRFRRKIDEVHLSQKLMGHTDLHTGTAEVSVPVGAILLLAYLFYRITTYDF